MSDGGLCSLSRPLQPVVGPPTIRTYVLTITRTLPNVGTQWTLWIDGKQLLTQVMKHSNVEKETVAFIGKGTLLLDDIVIEELGR